MLERDAPYVQIIEHYRQEIRAGRLKDGDMLPSGREIAAQFGVSLATAAKVATGLQALGLVTPRPGAGTVVTAPRPPADRARGGPSAHHAGLARPDAAGRQGPRPGGRARRGAAERRRATRRRPHGSGNPPPPGHVLRDGATAAVLTSWFPAALGDVAPDLLRKTPLAEEIERLPARLGRRLGFCAATDFSGGARVRNQARLTRRGCAQPPVRR